MIDLVVERMHRIVREEYQVLLRTEAEISLPQAYSSVAEFYRRTADACVEWMVSAEGERLRRAYLLVEDHAQRARFGTVDYRFICAPVWECDGLVAFVCRSALSAPHRTCDERLMSQVWCLSEETVLPPYQILRYCLPAERKRPPFRPDGVYPQGQELVFYKNGEGKVNEFRLPYRLQEDRKTPFFCPR